MKEQNYFQLEDDNLRCFVAQNIGVITIKSKVYEILTDLSESSTLAILFDKAEKDEQIKALLILNEDQTMNEKGYETYFKKLSHKKFGLYPSGALPFFLPRYVGLGRANEILLKKEKLSAKEALDDGFITAILSENDFEERCIQELLKICTLDISVVRKTKELMNLYRKDLEKYFGYEAKVVLI